MAEFVDVQDVRKRLRQVSWEYGYQSHWARANGLDPGYVSAVINGYRRPNDHLLGVLGFRERVLYEPLHKEENYEGTDHLPTVGLGDRAGP
jgi:hypothetical protein